MQDQRLLDLRERIAVVTGASGGFGAESARALAGAGAKVVLVGRDEARLRPLAEELGDRAVVVEGDVSKPGEADRVLETVVADYGRLDILVNAAGGATVGGLMNLGDETWEADIDLKLLGYLRMWRSPSRDPGADNDWLGDALVLLSLLAVVGWVLLGKMLEIQAS